MCKLHIVCNLLLDYCRLLCAYMLHILEAIICKEYIQKIEQFFTTYLLTVLYFTLLYFTLLYFTYLLTHSPIHSLTHSMEQSTSWGANRFTTGQESPCILWDPKVHFHIYKCPPPVPILGQINPIYASPSHFHKIYFNVVFPPMPGSFKWHLSLRFPHQNPECTCPLPHTCYMPCLSSIWSPE